MKFPMLGNDCEKLLGYHGANGWHDTLEPSARGTLGSGIYFTRAFHEAQVYGDVVHIASVSLANPWRIALEHGSAMADTWDFDCPCIDALLSLEAGRSFLLQAKDSDGKLGADFTTHLMSLGFDGIIGTYTDGSTEIVAFSSQQVKVAGRFSRPPAPGAMARLAEVLNEGPTPAVVESKSGRRPGR